MHLFVVHPCPYHTGNKILLLLQVFFLVLKIRSDKPVVNLAVNPFLIESSAIYITGISACYIFN